MLVSQIGLLCIMQCLGLPVRYCGMCICSLGCMQLANMLQPNIVTSLCMRPCKYQ